MTYRLIIQPLAESDITQAAMWYRDQRLGLDEEFLAEVHVALESALDNPRKFPRLRRRPEVRRVLTNRFPFRIFFVLQPDAVIVFRVLHAARHDRQWKSELPKN